MKSLIFCFFTLSLVAAPASIKPPVFWDQFEEPQACGPRGVLTSALPCSGCGDVFVSLSFLMWQAKLWGLEFATKSFVPNTPGASNQTIVEKLFVPDFAWKPGLKLLLGSHLPYDGWDLQVGWAFYRESLTHLKRDFESVIAPDGIGIIPLWQYPFLQIVGGNAGNPLRYHKARADWYMTFNSIDLELGRHFFPEQSIPMRLKIGGKLASIRQKYRAKYANGTTVLATTPQNRVPDLFQFVSSEFKTKTQAWSIGPRVGIESRWNILWGVNLIGHGAFSILCSFFEIGTEYNDVIEPTPGHCKMEMDEHFRELTPVCEAMLGLDWGMCFCNSLYFGLTIGYEWQYWWSVNHLRRNYVQTLPGETFDMRGELQMQGLNAAIKLDF